MAKRTLAFNPAMKAAVGAAGIATACTTDEARPLISGTELHYANRMGTAPAVALINLLKGGPSY